MEMASWLKSADNIRSHLSRCLRYCCAFLVLALFVLVFIQVLFRFVFKHPFDWAEELARYAFIWVSMLGAVLGVEQRAHFYVDMLANKLTSDKRRILDLGMRAIVFLFLVALGYVSINLTTVMGSQLSPILNLPLSYAVIVLPIGFFGMGTYILFCGIFQDLGQDAQE
jgi:TRAP-type C4-dicarboxylate transport system permease small subunit